VELHEIARGGDVTWHGPGQLVGYAILDLQARGRADVHRFLRDLESGLIDALEKLGLAAEIRSGMTGVFVAPSAPPRKIASIGVGLRGWVTWHGFALNVDPELAAAGEETRAVALARRRGPRLVHSVGPEHIATSPGVGRFTSLRSASLQPPCPSRRSERTGRL